MSKTDPKEEQKQLELISKCIKDKKAELKVFDDQMETKLAEIDKQREEVGKIQEGLLEESKAIGIRLAGLEKEEARVKILSDGIKLRRENVDKIALASDKRLTLAKAIEKKNTKASKDLESKKIEVDDSVKDLKKELESRIKTVNNIKHLKNEEYLKAKSLHEALMREREEISGFKKKHEKILKEVQETKAKLTTESNQVKDREDKIKKERDDLKAREIVCTNKEQEQKETGIEQDAMWIKINRKAEILGFEKELKDKKEVVEEKKEV